MTIDNTAEPINQNEKPKALLTWQGPAFKAQAKKADTSTEGEDNTQTIRNIPTMT